MLSRGCPAVVDALVRRAGCELRRVPGTPLPGRPPAHLPRARDGGRGRSRRPARLTYARSRPSVGSAEPSNSGHNSRCDIVRFLMFPEPEHRPSGRSQLRRCVGVTRDVSPQLVGPVRRVRACDGPMLGAGVPVATVDEHSDPLLGEDDVGAPPERGQRSVCDPEPKARCVQPLPDRQLGRGVPRAVALHHLPGGLTACPAFVLRHSSMVPRTRNRVRACGPSLGRERCSDETTIGFPTVDPTAGDASGGASGDRDFLVEFAGPRQRVEDRSEAEHLQGSGEPCRSAEARPD